MPERFPGAHFRQGFVEPLLVGRGAHDVQRFLDGIEVLERHDDDILPLTTRNDHHVAAVIDKVEITCEVLPEFGKIDNLHVISTYLSTKLGFFGRKLKRSMEMDRSLL